MPNAHLKHLCSVPPSIVKHALLKRTANAGKAADFNVAAWLHLPCMAQQMVSLILRYIDANNIREVQVDRGKVNAHNKILLSGITRLTVKERIENLEVYVYGDNLPENIRVEEIFVQAVEQPNHDKSQANN